MQVAAFLAVLVLASAAMPVHAASRQPRAGPKSSVRRCMKLGEARGEDGRSLRFTLRNACDHRLECTVTWEVTCGGEATEESQSSVVETEGSRSFLASAASCRSDSWRISPPRWKCSAT